MVEPPATAGTCGTQAPFTVLRKEQMMDPAQVTQLIGDLEAKVQENPEAARQRVAELKAKVQGLSPEEQEQIRQAVQELKDRAQDLPAEQQAQLADIVATIRG
jgi:ElaB/YqjD/DUF883 family membrane-anchored ribosome-binding protein